MVSYLLGKSIPISMRQFSGAMKMSCINDLGHSGTCVYIYKNSYKYMTIYIQIHV